MQRPGLCFVGAMVGKHPGHVITAGERLSALFKSAGYPVLAVSTMRNRYARFADVVQALFRQRHSFDVAIIDTYSGPSFVVEAVAGFLTSKLRKKVIHLMHGGNFPAFAERFPRWITRTLKRADAIVTPSAFLQRTVKTYGFDAEIIPNVIELNRYPFRCRSPIRPRLLWMRSFHPIWNPEMAIRVLFDLKSLFPDARLVMGGADKGLLSSMKKLAEDLRLADSVCFAGFLNMEGKIHAANESDVFINTNRIDNMPIALIEAAAFGLPIVSTNVGGIPDVLTNEETGLLVGDNDVQGMLIAIRSLVEHPDLAARLSQNARKQAEHYSWENVRPQWERLFDRILA